MDDAFRYARVFILLGLVVAATIFGIRNTLDWTLSAGPEAWAADDRHLRLSIEESQNSKYGDKPYKGGNFQAQYEKL